MKVGVPKEIKTLEFRVGMTPAGVRELVHDGHEVVVEMNAGIGIGMTDADYEAAGAKVVDTAEEVFATAEMIVKVKEPQLNECAMLREDQVLFTYLHLAADPAQTEALVKSGTTAIAYETVTADDGSLQIRVIQLMPASYPGATARFLQAIYPLPPDITTLTGSIEQEYHRYQNVSYLRQSLKQSFLLVLSLVLLLTVLLAMLAALNAARRMVSPLSSLATCCQTNSASLNSPLTTRCCRRISEYE